LGEEVVRVDGINQELTDWAREFTDERVRVRESDRFLRREVMSLKSAVRLAGEDSGRVEGRFGRQTLLNAALLRRVPIDRAVEMP